MKTEKKSVGIITFHCSDNYGAMLQAYGLKKYLRIKNVKADIVPYEPPFMTGRHWWFPYVPDRNWKNYLVRGWRTHLSMKGDFFRQRRNMKHFRIEHLLEKSGRKIFFVPQLRKLSYPYYIVGSDQIWNPDITCGLRKAYFGAFENRHKKKIIAYAASVGKESLPVEYDAQFAELISHIDVVSVREEKTIPYIKKFYQGDVTAMLDPVFLLYEKEWQKLEKTPAKAGYILVYTTEFNRELYDYAEHLSQEKAVPIIEVRTNKVRRYTDWFTDYTAGPAEFLGYIHKADYVVTNSFHAVAFSIIYHKRFVAFLHKTLGTRIENILHICGMEDRIYEPHKNMDIDSEINWDEADQKMAEKVKLSENFLMENIPLTGSGSMGDK